MNRTIAHINIAYFQTSVALAASGKKTLYSYPVALSNSCADNSMLIDISDRASSFGIRKGMKVVEARRICPDLKLLPPASGAQKRVIKSVLGKLSTFSPFLETAGPGHFFADISGSQRMCGGNNLLFADKVKNDIERSLGLKSSVGLGSNKLISKVATKILRPSGICSVLEGEEKSFMAPLKIADLPGIDKRIIKRLNQFNYQNIKDLQNVSTKVLSTVISDAARVIGLSKGIDNSPVFSYLKPNPQIEEKTILSDPTNDDITILYEIKRLTESACRRLRKTGLGVLSIRLNFEYSDGGFEEKGFLFRTPVTGDLTIFNSFVSIYNSMKKRRIRISTLSLILQKLVFPYGQMDLFVNSEREDRLFSALDNLRNKYGSNIIKFNGLPTLDLNRE